MRTSQTFVSVPCPCLHGPTLSLRPDPTAPSELHLGSFQIQWVPALASIRTCTGEKWGARLLDVSGNQHHAFYHQTINQRDIEEHLQAPGGRAPRGGRKHVGIANIDRLCSSVFPVQSVHQPSVPRGLGRREPPPPWHGQPTISPGGSREGPLGNNKQPLALN